MCYNNISAVVFVCTTSKESKKVKVLSYIKKVLASSCGIYTVIYFLFLLLSAAMGTMTPAIPLRNSAILYLFSLMLAASDLIFESKRMKLFVKILAHFGATLVSTLITLGLIGYSLGYRTILLSFIFLFLYALICPIYILIGRKHKKGATAEKKDEYVSIFKKD